MKNHLVFTLFGFVVLAKWFHGFTNLTKCLRWCVTVLVWRGGLQLSAFGNDHFGENYEPHKNGFVNAINVIVLTSFYGQSEYCLLG